MCRAGRSLTEPPGLRNSVLPRIVHPVSLSLKQVLHEAGAPLEHVYFIGEGVASVLTNMADGSTIEVGMIGAEGMVGVPALLGGAIAAQQAIVQVPGTALRMSAALC